MENGFAGIERNRYDENGSMIKIIDCVVIVTRGIAFRAAK